MTVNIDSRVVGSDSIPLTSLENRPTAAAYGKGDLFIINPNYRIKCTSDGVSWDSHGNSDDIAYRPSAAALGKGSWQTGLDTQISDGFQYISSSNLSFLPNGNNFEYKNNANWDGWYKPSGLGTLTVSNGILKIICDTTSAISLLNATGLNLRGAKNIYMRARVIAGGLTNWKPLTVTTNGYNYGNTFTFSALNTWEIVRATIDSPALAITQLGLSRSCTAGDILEVSDFIVEGYNPAYELSTASYFATQAANRIPTVTKKVIHATLGDYATINEALTAITDATYYNRYELICWPGEYWTGGISGQINQKDYIDITGTDRDNCKITGYLAPSTTNFNISNTSTIDGNYTSKISNFTISAQNMRYPIHWDGSRKSGVDKRLKNCTVIHLGNDEARADRVANATDPNLVWGNCLAIGSGMHTGGRLTVEDSTLVGTSAGFSVHNNITFAEACVVRLTRSRIIASVEGGSSVRVSSIRSTTKDKLIIEDCELVGDMVINDESWTGTSASHYEWDIEIRNSTPVKTTVSTAIPADSFLRPIITNSETELFNTSAATISRGMALAYNTSQNNARAMTSTDTIDKFIGIAAADIAIGSRGRVKTDGLELDTFIFADGVVTAALGTIYEVSAATPGAFKVNAASTAPIARGVGANVIRF